MIVDSHTHVFPPEIEGLRQRLVEADATFGELYGSPQASLATADELLTSMAAAGVDVSVALGFAWSANDLVRTHNDYLIDAAKRAKGRILPFCSLPMAAGWQAIESEARRCVEAGARMRQLCRRAR